MPTLQENPIQQALPGTGVHKKGIATQGERGLTVWPTDRQEKGLGCSFRVRQGVRFMSVAEDPYPGGVSNLVLYLGAGQPLKAARRLGIQVTGLRSAFEGGRTRFLVPGLSRSDR